MDQENGMWLDAFVTFVAESIVNLISRYRIKFDKGAVSFELKASSDPKNVEHRLAKIESARESLSEALAAMDDLKAAAEENKRDLDRLNEAIISAQAEKEGLTAQLDTMKQLAALDSESVRQVLRVPGAVEMWRERIYGFGSGIVGSIVATYVWEWIAQKP
jgi:septal ring factor EnvC (AmiA/AmiB activator)